MLNEIVEYIHPKEQKLIDAFWPGSLTITFKKKENSLPDIVSSGKEYIGVRYIKSEPCFSIIQAAGVPMVAPSANLSGKSTGIEIKTIIADLGEKVDYILDSGDVDSIMPSTIVKLEDDKIIVIREGKIKKKDIDKVILSNDL